MERADLPIAVHYWPVLPDDELDVAGMELYEPRDDNCYDGRGAWVCTRRRGHELPHVGMGGARVVAVWDQQYFAQTSSHSEHDGPQGAIPLESTVHVPSGRR